MQFAMCSKCQNRTFARGPDISVMASGATSSYSTRSSARNKKSRLIGKPMAWAVFRLTTSSNFTGCSIGKIGRFGAIQNLLRVTCDAFCLKDPAWPVRK